MAAVVGAGGCPGGWEWGLGRLWLLGAEGKNTRQLNTQGHLITTAQKWQMHHMYISCIQVHGGGGRRRAVAGSKTRWQDGRAHPGLQ